MKFQELLEAFSPEVAGRRAVFKAAVTAIRAAGGKIAHRAGKSMFKSEVDRLADLRGVDAPDREKLKAAKAAVKALLAHKMDEGQEALTEEELFEKKRKKSKRLKKGDTVKHAKSKYHATVSGSMFSANGSSWWPVVRVVSGNSYESCWHDHHTHGTDGQEPPPPAPDTGGSGDAMSEAAVFSAGQAASIGRQGNEYELVLKKHGFKKKADGKYHHAGNGGTLSLDRHGHWENVHGAFDDSFGGTTGDSLDRHLTKLLGLKAQK